MDRRERFYYVVDFGNLNNQYNMHLVMSSVCHIKVSPFNESHVVEGRQHQYLVSIPFGCEECFEYEMRKRSRGGGLGGAVWWKKI